MNLQEIIRIYDLSNKKEYNKYIFQSNTVELSKVLNSKGQMVDMKKKRLMSELMAMVKYVKESKEEKALESLVFQLYDLEVITEVEDLTEVLLS